MPIKFTQWIPDLTTVPLPKSDPGCAKWLCQCPSRPGPPIPTCLPAGCAKMMLGSFRLIGLGLPPELPVGLPDAERRLNLRPGGEGAEGVDVLRTGPWMGQEVEGMWTVWWGCPWEWWDWCWCEGRSPSAVSVPGWYWPGWEVGKLKRDRGTWGWTGCFSGAVEPFLLCEGWEEQEDWDELCGTIMGCGE